LKSFQTNPAITGSGIPRKKARPAILQAFVLPANKLRLVVALAHRAGCGPALAH
jgi:hypothetical protein